jgi:hypothetical protein
MPDNPCEPPKCCPYCGPEGDICQARIAATGTSIFICDECDAVWFSTQDIRWDTGTDFATYMASIGREGLWSELTDIVQP